MQPQGPANPQGGPYNPYGPTPNHQPPSGAPRQPYPANLGQPQPYQQGNFTPGQQPYPYPNQQQAGAQYGPRSNQQQVGQQPIRPGQQNAQQAYQQPGQPQKPQTEELPPPPDPEATPYDFFMQPKPNQPLNPLPMTGKKLGNIPVDYDKMGTGGGINTSGLKGKFPLIAGGGIVLVIILFVAMALAPKDPTGPQLVNIAQIQQEVVRVCTQGGTKAKYRSTRNFATTCSAGVFTNQRELLSYINKQQYAFNAKELGAKASAETDAKLKSAQSSSTYDDEFRSIAGEQLQAYDSALTAQLGITTGANAREVLTRAQNSNQLLIKMVNDDSDKTIAPTISD